MCTHNIREFYSVLTKRVPTLKKKYYNELHSEKIENDISKYFELKFLFGQR